MTWLLLEGTKNARKRRTVFGLFDYFSVFVSDQWQTAPVSPLNSATAASALCGTVFPLKQKHMESGAEFFESARDSDVFASAWLFTRQDYFPFLSLC